MVERVRILCFFFVGVITTSVCNVVPFDSDEQEARAFVQEASTKLFKYRDKMTQRIFETDENNPEELMSTFETILITTRRFVKIVEESKQFNDSKITDPELKHVLKTIRKSAHEGVLGDQKSIKLLVSLGILDKLSSYKEIPSYRNKSIHLAFIPDIQNIFKNSNDPEELKYYWTTWRENIGFWASKHFVNLVESIKKIAKFNEFSPLELWFDEYNITNMEIVMMQIEPIYIQLHGFIRKQLNKKYGDLVIKPNEPIPHHLFEQVLAQSWTSGSIIDDMYPYPYKDLPPYDEILMQNNYDTLKMYKMADRFYQSLGFNSITDEYWVNHFKVISNKTESDCEEIVFDESPNVYMHYCPKMNFNQFLLAHGYMGEIYYAREKINLPVYYFDGYHLQYPMGQAVILSASSPKHLNTIGLATEFGFTEAVKMNRLLRMGINTLLNLPVYFVHTKVMSDLFAGSVDFDDLNKHYWTMMEKYVGVSTPIARSSNAYEFSFEFYSDLKDNKQANNFMKGVLGYQFYEKLCEISGQYSRSNKSEPIYNCDFYGSKKAGDALKKMMRLGSSKSMREVLATIIPDYPSVNAKSLIEYYTPMQSWLIEKNHEDNAIVGWAHSDTKVPIVGN